MTSQKKIAILLNGPKRTGKDTAANALVEIFGDRCGVFKFTRPVKDETHARYGIDVPFDHYEELKDTPLPEFGGLTPREAYIKVGDEMRAAHGPDIVTELFCENLVKSDTLVVINPDCGGDHEAEGIARVIGADRVVVLRIHKEGHDYRDDCRGWVETDKLVKIDVVNVADEQEAYEEKIRQIGRAFFEGFGDLITHEEGEAERPRRFG